MKEIIIIKENIHKLPKIKAFLEQEHINYEVYQEPSQKESIFAHYDKVLKDEEREKEAKELENSEQEDIVNEEW